VPRIFSKLYAGHEDFGLSGARFSDVTVLTAAITEDFLCGTCMGLKNRFSRAEQ
jgi:hypothetical protein